MNNSYHNTTRLPGRKASKYNTAAQDQENDILRIMYQVREASPWEVWYIFNRIKKNMPLKYDMPTCSLMMRMWGPGQWAAAMAQIGVNDTPITSIRRGMTNLTNSGHLIKTDRLITGAKGKPESIWKLKTITL
jgi:hypothetical protein